MESATEACSDIDKALILEGLARATRILCFGMLLSGVAILFFILWHNPHFPHPQNFLERYISKNYRGDIISDMGIILLSGAYILFSTISFRLRWSVGMFSITLFFLGLAIPLLIAQTWYVRITGVPLHVDVAVAFVFLGILFDIVAIMHMAQSDENNDQEVFLEAVLVFSALLLSVFALVMYHDSEHADVHLRQAYQEAKSFPKAISYSMDWHNISPYKVHADLQSLGGYGAMIVAKAYQRAGYETSVVAWNNLMQLGRYVNTLQSQGLLSGGIPWQITPRANTLRHLHRLEPYGRFFRHPNVRFYLNHSGVHFTWRYRRIQALHRGDFFIRNLASISKVEAVSRWLEPGYRYEISLTLGTGGVSKYYEDHARQYKKWQRCMESEGSSFCSNLKPERGYIPNN